MLLIFRIVLYISIFGVCTLIGKIYSNKYINREFELKEFKNALNVFRTKIKFTYEPIPEVFNQIGNSIKNNVGEIFKISSKNMNKTTAEKAWIEAIENSKRLNIDKEDKEVLKRLSKLLGKTDIEGQLSEIELVNTFLDTQIEKAEKDRNKNEKMCKTLGMLSGITMVILLM